MINDAIDNRYEQLRISINFLSAMLEEGTLVARYDDNTREEIADVLRILLDKVEGLPSGVPKPLVEATAVRAIVDASEQYRQSEEEQKRTMIEKRMREAEMMARLKGFSLTKWEQIGTWEYQISGCDGEGFIYVTPDSTYDLLSVPEELLFD